MGFRTFFLGKPEIHIRGCALSLMLLVFARMRVRLRLCPRHRPFLASENPAILDHWRRTQKGISCFPKITARTPVLAPPEPTPAFLDHPPGDPPAHTEPTEAATKLDLKSAYPLPAPRLKTLTPSAHSRHQPPRPVDATSARSVVWQRYGLDTKQGPSTHLGPP